MDTSIDNLIQKLQQKIINLKKDGRSLHVKIEEINVLMKNEKQKIHNRLSSEISEQNLDPKLLVKQGKTPIVDNGQIQGYFEQVF
jgi:hypothetical protein